MIYGYLVELAIGPETIVLTSSKELYEWTDSRRGSGWARDVPEPGNGAARQRTRLVNTIFLST